MSHTNSDSVVKQALLAVEQMKARVEASERKQKEPIAIIGMACRFPGQAPFARQLLALAARWNPRHRPYSLMNAGT
jgi:hypothetical protein